MHLNSTCSFSHTRSVEIQFILFLDRVLSLQYGLNLHSMQSDVFSHVFLQLVSVKTKFLTSAELERSSQSPSLP